tara:strand:+ start:11725 stop:13080 length:1356 start_codon:yes stop_codon:yes gene_type:complete
MGRDLSLRFQTILVVSSILVLFHAVSLGLYTLLSASSVTLEREAQIADRVVAATRLIEQAPPGDRPYLAKQLSGEWFVVSIDQAAIDSQDELESGAEITQLISRRFLPREHVVAADYVEPGDSLSREITAQRSTGPFRIHENLIVSIDMPGGTWLNFKVTGSSWEHIIAPAAIPSLTLMTIGIIMIAAWAVSRPLRTLSRLAQASDEMSVSVSGASPLDESGPVEINRVARAFNHMQRRVQRSMSAQNEMLGAISHDFRTPLTRLRLRVERLEDSEQREKAINDIEEMEALIQFTLDYARDNAQSQKHEMLNCRELVNEVVGQARTPDHPIEVSIAEDLQINCHPLAMRRAITNLVSNALFYGKQVRVSGYRTESELVIEVEDDGPGIPCEKREHVFTPFYRLEQSRNRDTGGAGLGLSISQMMIHSHGGQIHLLESNLGGLKAKIVLPTT